MCILDDQILHSWFLLVGKERYIGHHVLIFELIGEIIEESQLSLEVCIVRILNSVYQFQISVNNLIFIQIKVSAYLPQANWTQGKRFPISFIDEIGSVHETLIVGTMCET